MSYQPNEQVIYCASCGADVLYLPAVTSLVAVSHHSRQRCGPATGLASGRASGGSPSAVVLRGAVPAGLGMEYVLGAFAATNTLYWQLRFVEYSTIIAH